MTGTAQHRGAQSAQVKRILIAVIIGGLTGIVSIPYHWQPGGDFVVWPVRAARDLIYGIDPYSYAVDEWQISYPLTAAITAIPFTPLDDGIAGALFLALSSALMAMALTKDGEYYRLLAFASYPFWNSVINVQYGPLMIAVAGYPLLLPLAFIKPHIGLPATVYHKPTRAGIGLSIALILASLIIDPLWPIKWVQSFGSYSGVPPLLWPFGFLILLAALRLRIPSMRLVLAMAILPKRGYYDLLPLWYGMNSKRSMIIMTLASWCIIPLHLYINPAVILFLIPIVYGLSATKQAPSFHHPRLVNTLEYKIKQH